MLPTWNLFRVYALVLLTLKKMVWSSSFLTTAAYLVAQYRIVVSTLNIKKVAFLIKMLLSKTFFTINEVIYFSIIHINKFPKKLQKALEKQSKNLLQVR